MKKLCAVLLCAAMLAGCGSAGAQASAAASQEASASAAAATVADGTYTGTAAGNNGPISVSVTVTDGKIADVQVTDNVETQGIGDVAVEQIPQAMVTNNTLNVDNVTGATVTSAAIKAACRDALKDADPSGDAFNTPVETQKISETRTMEADVVVIGAGGGGVAAATKAADMGKSVILVEKNDMVGGDTMCNAGTLIATGSKFQKEKLGENNDSPELAYDDIMRIGLNKNDPVLVKMITETIGSTVDWLVDDMKVPYDVAATQYPDHSANRQIGVVGRSYEFFQVMVKNFEDRGGQLLLGTKAVKLLTDADGNVTGVECEDKQGTIDITAKATIDAAGGFGANTSLLPDSLSGYMFYGRTTDMGDGLNLGTEVGADTINMDLVKVYPQGVETVPGRALAATASSTAATNGHGAIYVNTKGDRVVKETGTLADITNATVAQDDKILYLIMDEDAWKAYVDKSLEDKLVASEDDLYKWESIENDGRPVLAQGTDLSELAKTMGIDADELAKAVEQYNADCAAGTDAFGKENPVALAEGGTYYVVEQRPRFCTTLGGLKANENMQILNTSGEPIGNLYGAGSVVGGANGADSMTAMMNSWAIGSGVVAGEKAAESIAD